MTRIGEMPLRKTRKRGGKYVGEGAFGCSFRPALKCRGEAERLPGSLSKIMKSTYAEDEYAGRNALAAIDPDQNYFLYPLRKCNAPSSENLDPLENNMTSCKIRKDFGPNLSNAKLILLKEGGQDLEKIKLTAADILPFFKGFAQLLEGLILLQTNDLVHFDIKPANLVAKKQDDGSFQFHFIDFGFLTSTANFDRSFVKPRLHNNYFIWPYETRFVSPSFRKEKITEDDILEFYDKALDHNTFLKTHSYKGGSVPDYEDLYTMYKSGDLTAAERIERRAQLLKAVDIYSMGISLARIYFIIFRHYSILGLVGSQGFRLPAVAAAWHEEVRNEISRPLFDLADDMTVPEWFDRPTANMVLQRYKALFPAMERLFTKEKVQTGLEPLGTILPSGTGGMRKRRLTRKRSVK